MKLSPLALLLLLVASCAREDVTRLPHLTLDFAFAQKNKCQGVSPEIRVAGAPQSVTRYEIKLVDLDVPSFHHWSQTIAAASPTIPEGAGVRYYGPCPPSGTHRYKLSVLGRNSSDRALAYGERTVVASK